MRPADARHRRTPARLLAAVLAVALAGPAAADEPPPPCHGPPAGAAGAPAAAPAHAGHAPAAAPGAAGAAVRLALPDAPLVDQEGRAVRFASDVLGGRIVVLDFVFTTCTTVCPVLSAILRRVQEGLGEELGGEVALVSVTVDPVRDTPERLAAYARRHGARPGWTWLTGAPAEVERVLRAAGAYTPRFQDHPPVVLVGDARSGEWTRLNGFPSDTRVLAMVAELRARRGATAAAEVGR